MAALTTYTTYATIRGILGVASTEITDTVLALPHLPLQFELEMADVDGGVGAVLTQYTSIGLVAASERSAAQTLLFNLVGLMAGFSVARQLLTSLEVFAPKTITDGAARIDRVADPYSKLREGVSAGYNTLMSRLRAALVVLVPAAAVTTAEARTFITSAGLGTDPVTND